MLDEILANKRHEVERLAEIDVATLRPSGRGFRKALEAKGLSIIAEVKRRSPSGGTLADSVDPATQARRYAEGGARAVSVLVDRAYFGGSWNDLSEVSQFGTTPVLCKEFIIDARQVRHARRAGADACLLIVAALDDARLSELLREIESLGMDALVETHDEREVRRAVDAGARIIGVNNRNLTTLEIDLSTVERLEPLVPSECVLVAESGYNTTDDLARLPDTVNALLVGTALMRSADPAKTLRRWIDEAGRRQR